MFRMIQRIRNAPRQPMVLGFFSPTSNTVVNTTQRRQLHDHASHSMSISRTNAKTIKRDLESEIEASGREAVKAKLRAELDRKRSLDTVIASTTQQALNQVFKPTVSRASEGYNIGGLFWNQMRATLLKIYEATGYHQLKNERDILSARQIVGKRLLETTKETPMPEKKAITLKR